MATLILALLVLVCFVAAVKLIYTVAVGVGKALWKWAPFVVLVAFGLLYFWASADEVEREAAIRSSQIQSAITHLEASEPKESLESWIKKHGK